MHLAVREVLELSDRCFSAAGFTEGPARSAAEAVWWTELYRGSGLRMLHGLLPELRGWDPTALSFDAADDFVSVIDAGGQPSLVSGTPAVDLATAAAGRHGVGVVHAGVPPADETLPTVGHVAYAAAERGHLAIVLAAGGDPRTVVGRPDDPHPLLAERELGSPSAAHADLLEVVGNGVSGRRDNPLTQAFFTGESETEYGTAGSRLLNRLLRRSLRPDGGGGAPDPGYTLVCLNPDHPRHSGGLRRVVDGFVADEPGFTRVFRPAEIRDRAERLLAEGVEVPEPVWRDVFDRSSEVLAPEFEGSYRGAGFDINE